MEGTYNGRKLDVLDVLAVSLVLRLDAPDARL